MVTIKTIILVMIIRMLTMMIMLRTMMLMTMMLTTKMLTRLPQVAATPNNSLCAVGVAFDAQIGGIRMLDGQVFVQIIIILMIFIVFKPHCSMLFEAFLK